MRTRMRDRRKGRRFDVRFNARISVRGPSPVTDLPTHVLDVSRTGMCVLSPAHLPAHRMASIRGTCDGVEFNTRGRIVRVEQTDDGRFLLAIEIDPEVLVENPFPTSVTVTRGDMPELMPGRPAP